VREEDSPVGPAAAEPLPAPAEPPSPDGSKSVTGAQIEAASDDAERRLRARCPGIRYVFLDPTRGVAGRNHREGGLDI
jgi:hypothetical protein